MKLYSAALFLHVVGATTPEQLGLAAGIAGLTGKLGPASVVGILAPGVYMVKPGLLGALVAIAAGVAIGVAASVPAWRSSPLGAVS